MEKNSPINSVYLIALACCALVTYVNSLYSALIFGVAVVATYLVSLSVVSMIEKITNNHIRFMIYSLISATLITVLKIVCTFVNIEEVVLVSQNLEFAVIPCLIMAIYPIYFEETYSGAQYFVSILVSSAVSMLMLLIFGSLIEILGYGSIAGHSLNFAGLEFFTYPYGAFFVIATLCILFNLVRRLYLKKSRSFRTMVDKYKIIITEIRDSELRKKEILKKDNEGGKE